MSRVYTVSDNITVSGSAVHLQIISHATRPFEIVSFYIGGTASASGGNAFGLARSSTTGTSPGGDITPSPVDGLSPAFGGNVYSSWGTPPGIGETLHSFAVDQMGGQAYIKWPRRDRFLCPAGAGAGDSILLRSNIGSGSFFYTVTIEEY